MTMPADGKAEPALLTATGHVGAASRPARYRSVVIGGGAYGCSLALARRELHGGSVLLLERSDALLQRASYANQARVHQGYHYPYSFLTAVRSAANVPRFLREFGDCVRDDFTMYYAIARRFSKVTAAQFELFCRRIGAPIAPARDEVTDLFDGNLVEQVFRVQEKAFDAEILRSILEARLNEADVDVVLGANVSRLEDVGEGRLRVHVQIGSSTETYITSDVVCCTYARLNVLLRASDLPPVALKHEIAELALIEPPPALRKAGVTVMCGPFFSSMPFPHLGLHSLSHVRYTPHTAWEEAPPPAELRDPYEVLDRFPRRSHFASMLRDAKRFLPVLADAVYRDSLWEVKTVLPRNESDDGRPILVRLQHGHPALTCVLGSKVDNVFDVIDALSTAVVGPA